MIWTLLGMGAIVAAMAAVALQRGLQLRRLVRHGVTTRGRIDRKWRHTSTGGRSIRRMRYSFTDPQGCRHTRAIIASQSEFDMLDEGQEISIVYLPDKPGVSALQSMVALAQQALKPPEDKT